MNHTHFDDDYRQVVKQRVTVSRQLGFTMKPQESLVNELGYFMLSPRKYKSVESLLKLNVANYPASYNTYDSYGDYLVAPKDTVNAIANFQRALSLKETSETRKKLTALLSRPKTELIPTTKN